MLPARPAGSDQYGDPPFTASTGFFLFAGGEANDDQEGVGEHEEGDVAMPAAKLPSPHLVVIHSNLPLGLGEALFYDPAVLANSNEFLQGRLFGTIGLVETTVFRIVGTHADQQPPAHPLLGFSREVQARPLPGASATAACCRMHLRVCILGQPFNVLLYLLLAPTERDCVGLGNHHGVGASSLLQPLPEGVQATVEGVRNHPLRGNPGLKGSLQHAFSQLYLILKDDPFRDSGLHSSDGVIRPSLR